MKNKLILSVFLLMCSLGTLQAQTGNQSIPAAGNGLLFVAATAATCTPGVTASVQLSVAPYQIYYCSASNTWTAVGSGSGTITNQATNSIPVNTNGTATALNSVACTPPVTIGQFNVGYTNPTAAGTAPNCSQVGVPASTVNAATTTYAVGTVAPNESLCFPIVHDIAGSQPVVATIPTPTTLANANACVIFDNHSAQTDTLKATTWTMQANSAAAVAGSTGITINPGTKAVAYVDPFNATQWIVDTTALGASGAAFPVTVTGGTSGGIPYFNSTTQESASPILNTNVLMKGGGAGNPPTNTLCDEGQTTANTLTCTNTAGLKVVSVATGTSPPTCTVGTAGAHCFTEGTAPTGASSVDAIWANSTAHCLDQNSNNVELGCIVSEPAGLVTIQTISGADYTNATVTPSTLFSWTLPATAAAQKYKYTCDILWESTAATLVGPVFGLNISAAPTQLTGMASVQNTLAGADINGYLSNTTTGSQTLVTSSAAGVTSTNYWAKIWGTIEGAPVAGATFIINAASTSGTTASLNIRRGSGCKLEVVQ